MSDDYRGPERRARSARDIEFDKRLHELDDRLRHVEEVLVNTEDPDAGMVAVVHKIRHDLANNTQTTIGTRKTVSDMSTNIENLLAMMGTFTALNQFARGVQLLIKRVLPVMTALGTAWGAFKIWGPK